MFEVYATKRGWEVYWSGAAAPIAIFDRLSTVKKTVEKTGSKLTVYINGYAVS